MRWIQVVLFILLSGCERTPGWEGSDPSANYFLCAIDAPPFEPSSSDEFRLNVLSAFGSLYTIWVTESPPRLTAKAFKGQSYTAELAESVSIPLTEDQFRFTRDFIYETGFLDTRPATSTYEDGELALLQASVGSKLLTFGSNDPNSVLADIVEKFSALCGSRCDLSKIYDKYGYAISEECAHLLWEDIGRDA